MTDQTQQPNEQTMDFTLPKQARAEGFHQDPDLPHAILSNLVGGIVAFDMDVHVTFLNPAAERMLGRSMSELLGRPVQEALYGRLAESDQEIAPDNPFGTAIRTARPTRNEHDQFLRGDGTTFPVAYTVTPILQAGVAIGGVISFQDMTSIHHVQQLGEEYLSLLAHDLRTPLTMILARSDFLQQRLLRHDLPQEAQMAAAIIESAKRMNRLIDAVLDLDRLEQQALVLEQMTFDLAHLVAGAIEQLEPSAATQRIVLSGSAPVRMRGDPPHVERVVLNLLSNALRYSEPHTTVQVRVFQDQEQVLLSVADAGDGIPADDLPYLFEKHYRIQSKRNTEGTGLGLYISRLIVEAHGGTIQVQSQEGQGSTFTVAFPRVEE